MFLRLHDLLANFHNRTVKPLNFGRDHWKSIGGGGLDVVHLSCNDGRHLAIQYFAENEGNVYVLPLDGSPDRALDCLVQHLSPGTLNLVHNLA